MPELSIASVPTAKAWVRSICPAVLCQFGQRWRTRNMHVPIEMQRFDGPLASWGKAVARSDGWDADVIKSKSVDAALKVRDGLAEFERDTIVCDKISYSPAILAFLALALSRKPNRLRVLDCPDPVFYYPATHPTWCFGKARFIADLVARGFTLVEDFTDDPARRFDHCGLMFVAEGHE